MKLIKNGNDIKGLWETDAICLLECPKSGIVYKVHISEEDNTGRRYIYSRFDKPDLRMYDRDNVVYIRATSGTPWWALDNIVRAIDNKQFSIGH